MFMEIEMAGVLTPEIQALLDAHNLRAVGVGLIVEPVIPDRTYHIVEPGETLTHIANKYNVTVAHLIQINDLRNPDFIKVGQIIFI